MTFAVSPALFRAVCLLRNYLFRVIRGEYGSYPTAKMRLSITHWRWISAKHRNIINFEKSEHRECVW